jgi:serine/threonine protein kinase
MTKTQPANVLISSSGRVKLADFGIVSQREDDETSLQMNATMIGTTRYMSPERLRGKPYTMSSDVWSLGLVLLECLLGDCPFESISSVVSYLCRTK